MSRAINYVPRIAIFLAGVATAALMPRRERVPSGDGQPLDDLKKNLAALEARLEAHETSGAARLDAVETRLAEHAAKLADVPSTTEIVAAMEQLLNKTMASLDDRLTSQARSIDVLRTTVSQTDSLLERVLESLDTLQGYSDSSDLSADPLVTRPGA